MEELPGAGGIGWAGRQAREGSRGYERVLSYTLRTSALG